MNNTSIDFFKLTSYAWMILFLYWLYTSMKTKVTIKKQNYLSRSLHLILMALAFTLVYGNYSRIGFLGKRFLPHENWISYLGILINISGIIFAIIARGWLGDNWSAIVTIKKDHELVRGGPYSITRHPIYTGFLFGLVGAVIVLGEIRGLIAILLLFIAIQIKTITEEKFMRKTFAEYDDYSRHTKKLIPFIY